MAERYGAGYAETLTGFKWLARVDGLRYAYEEAIGYCVDPAGVRDKDGISAALLLAEVAAGAKAQGRTLLDLLDDLADTYGVHATDQLSFRVADLSLIDAAMARVRSDPPHALGGRDVLATDDLSTGSDSLPPTDALRFTLDGGGRVVVRPSGTEPKLKCYLEVVVEVPTSTAADRLAVARAEAAEALERIARDLATALGL
jgi:phosphomannomutase